MGSARFLQVTGYEVSGETTDGGEQFERGRDVRR